RTSGQPHARPSRVAAPSDPSPTPPETDMSDSPTSSTPTPLPNAAPTTPAAGETQANADLRALPDPGAPRATAEAILFEIRRVIVGQDQMLERVLVGLLSGGHLLLEGVPGLAKTFTIKTLAETLGGSFKRIQF